MSADGKKPRKRCADGAAVFAVVRQFIKRPNDVQYRSVMEGSVDSDRLLKHRDLLLALRRGPCPNGSITAKAAKECATLLAGDHPDWCLGHEAKDFISTFAGRLRAMLRDVQQAMLKTKGRTSMPGWLTQLLGDASTSAASAATAAQSSTQPVRPIFMTRIPGIRRWGVKTVDAHMFEQEFCGGPPGVRNQAFWANLRLARIGRCTAEPQTRNR